MVLVAPLVVRLVDVHHWEVRFGSQAVIHAALQLTPLRPSQLQLLLVGDDGMQVGTFINAGSYK
jgi:hypothetical protein